MRYVILGSSAAGISGAREIRKKDGDGEVIIISKDKDIYSRCILHHYISGERNMEELSFVEEDFMELYDIDFMGGIGAESIDRSKKEIELSNDETISYDKLLIATGSNSFFPPIKNLEDTDNILGFRHIEDCYEIVDKMDDIQDIVIIGGGLVGVDALSGLLDSNKNLSLVEMQDRLLPIQLDKRASETYEKLFEDKGVDFYFEIGAEEVVSDEDGNIKSLKLNNGEELDCDLLIMAAGVRSNIGFLKDSGIELTEIGLKINENGETNDPDIFGAGDVTGWGPIWSVAVKEGIVAGSNMAGDKVEMTDFFASRSTMNYLGVPTMSLGEVGGDDGSIVEIEEDEKNYKKIVHKDGRIIGAIIQGDLSYTGVLTQLIKDEIDISRVKKPLFKIDYSDFFHTKDNFEFSYE